MENVLEGNDDEEACSMIYSQICTSQTTHEPDPYQLILPNTRHQLTHANDNALNAPITKRQPHPITSSTRPRLLPPSPAAGVVSRPRLLRARPRSLWAGAQSLRLRAEARRGVAAPLRRSLRRGRADAGARMV